MEQKGYALAFLAGIAWGTLGLISHYLKNIGVGPFEIAFLRLFFAFLSMFIFYFMTDIKKIKIRKKEVKHSFLIGIITQGTMSLAVFKCITMTSTTVAIMMVCLGPLFTAILSSIIFKEKITLFKGLALFVAFYGAFLVVTGGNFSVLKTNILGIIVGLISAFAYGCFPILSKSVPEKYNMTGIIMYSFLVGATCIIPIIDAKVIFQTLSFNMIGFSIMLGVIPTILSFTFYSKALKFTTPTKAGIMSLAELPTAAIIGHLFLKEYLSTANTAGIIILLTGIMISKIDLSKKTRVLDGIK